MLIIFDPALNNQQKIVYTIIMRFKKPVSILIYILNLSVLLLFSSFIRHTILICT